MKNNVKILSALLVSVMGLGLTTASKVSNKKEDNSPLVLKDVLRAKAIDGSGTEVDALEAPVENNKVSNVLAQVNTPSEGKINIRFVAGIDTYTYGAAQFNIVLKDASNNEVVNKTVAVNHAYLGIEASDEVKYAADLFGEGYNYLIAYTLTDVPSTYWGYNFEVTASIGTDSENITATSEEVKTKKINNMIVATEHKELVLEGTWNPHGNVYLVFGWSSNVENAIENVPTSAPTIVSYSAIGIVDGVEYPFTERHNDGTKAKFFTNDAMVAVTGDIANATYTLKVSFIDTNATEWVANVKVINGKKVSLDGYKSSAVSELVAYPASKNYSEGLYTEENWTTLNSYITNGTAEINNAASYDEVDAYLAAAKANIDNVEQKGLSLDEAVNNAKSILDAHVATLSQTNYSQENWNVILGYQSAAYTALDACESEEAINTTLEEYKSLINSVKMLPKEFKFSGVWNPHGNVYLVLGWTNNFTNDNVLSYSAIGVVDGVEYPFTVRHNDGTMAKFFTNDAMVAVTGDIAKATYLLKISFLVDDGFYYEAEIKVVNGKKVAINDYKTVAANELDSYLSSNDIIEGLYTEENWSLVQEYVTTAKNDINSATSYDKIDEVLSKAKEDILAVEKRDLSIDESKTAAKNSLNGYVASLNSSDYSEENWATIQGLLVSGSAAIDACENEEAITSTLADYKAQIAAVETNYIELELGGNWNPHGDGFLVFGWTNAGLTNDNIKEYSVVAVIDGVESEFTFDRIDGAVHAFFRNTDLGGNIGSANYTLKVRFVTNDGTVYATTRQVVSGKLA